MPKNGKGIENNNWKGGKSISSDGYVLIRVGKEHHLADTRGYAYEHRLNAELKLSRKLLPEEEVHHDDENRQNNAFDNIIIKKSRAYHSFEHRKPNSELKHPDEENAVVVCACGCGNTFKKFDIKNRPRKFLPGHNMYKNAEK